ncbi:hypothetical protein DTO271G3_6867 [Paecilomyces variotii]|nr:hypothetical protein DTO271G3_6867 [Paecilomyces variotii]
MKFLAVAALLPLLASAIPRGQPMAKRQTDIPPFTVTAARSGSPIHLLPLEAAGQSFWLGGSPATYCPTGEGIVCPPGTDTVIVGASALDVEVPGGQLLYVDPSGALSFTQAHSINIPTGSAVGPFQYQAGQPFGHWTFTGWNSTGFMACPQPQGNTTNWRVYAAISNATVPTGNVSDCLGFDALTYPWQSNSTAAAWQYI